jgi:hypothetical protein
VTGVALDRPPHGRRVFVGDVGDVGWSRPRRFVGTPDQNVIKFVFDQTARRIGRSVEHRSADVQLAFEFKLFADTTGLR